MGNSLSPNYVNIFHDSTSPPSYSITNKQGTQASNPFSDRPKPICSAF